MKKAMLAFVKYADTNSIKRMYEVFPAWLNEHRPKVYDNSQAIQLLEQVLHKNDRAYRALDPKAKLAEKQKRTAAYDAIFDEAFSGTTCPGCDAPLHLTGKKLPPSMRCLLDPPMCSLSCSLQSEKRQETRRATCQLKYGKDSVSETQGWKDSVAKSFTDRFGKGVTNPSQVPEVMAKILKARYGRKTYEKDGKLFTYQGYEGVVIKHLVDTLGVPVAKVHCTPSKVGSYPYTYLGKEHRYFPDMKFRRKGVTWIVEVKSVSTLASTRSIASRVLAKAKAMWALGGNFKFRLLLCSESTMLEKADNVAELKALINKHRKTW